MKCILFGHKPIEKQGVKSVHGDFTGEVFVVCSECGNTLDRRPVASAERPMLRGYDHLRQEGAR